ncbi:MAG: HAMP domain-containing sensor histidine kinase [Verrucomicrobiota bacterium]
MLPRRNQLQWAALLALAVVLPTVSLLWFMSRVIANERLVVRQKLAALYADKLNSATAETGFLFTNRLAVLGRPWPGNPYALVRGLVLEDRVQAVLLRDEAGIPVYPQPGLALGGDEPDQALAVARELELVRRQFAEAAEAYGRYTNDANLRVALEASLGRSRCLAKAGDLPGATAACRDAAFPAGAPGPAQLAVDHARLFLLSLLQRSAPDAAATDLRRRTVSALLDDLYASGAPSPRLAPSRNLFLARMLLEDVESMPPAELGSDATRIRRLQALVAAEDLALSVGEDSRIWTGPMDAVVPVREGEEAVYGLRHPSASGTILILLSPDGLAPLLAGYRESFAGTAAAYRVLDPGGRVVSGTAQARVAPFLAASLPEGFPGWKVELYFEGSDVFEQAARRQIAVYLWTGGLVIVLVLGAGVFAVRAVNRQLRLNAMKNDFIATVSHELKTPLASMRVLVDTLLEGRVRDEAQAQEYLRLTARENERLSRMIDNFLTFSRMERNKVAFSIGDISAEAVARDAVESVKTKLETHHCRLEVKIGDGLPPVRGDHDALVTVLVNLLDNACKYTGDDKQVELRIFAERGQVCFAVSDNGIGIARRHWRRIFDRFYQVDNSLARKAEGCGLGLSIVKFIVDAHRGTIEVDSRPGAGSTFTVRLPAGAADGR